MSENKQEQVLTVDGVEHAVSSLPPDVQHFLGVYTKWQGELNDAREQVFKLEAALRGLSIEIETRVRRQQQPPKP